MNLVFTIVQLKNINEATEFKVSEKYIGDSRIWNLNEGELLIHSYNKSPNLLREIGFTSALEKGRLFKFTSEQMRTVFSHYVQKGLIKYMEYDVDSEEDDDELSYFQKQLGFKKVKTSEEMESILEYYDYMEFERFSTPINLNLFINNSLVRFSTNSVISSMSSKLHTDDFLSLYNEIFNVLNLPFLLQSIHLIEKEKVTHPMNQSHDFVRELLEIAGDTAKTSLSMSDEEYRCIKEGLLQYTSGFTNKKIYK